MEWLLRQELLSGPFLFTDYWATVLRLPGVQAEEHVERGWLEPGLFRVGLDRPDLELPRFRHYLLLFFLGPVLLPFRAFRRVGRFPIRSRGRVGEAVQRALAPYRLALDPAGPGRVHVRKGEETLAEDLLDPRLVAGFASLFFASYKLPLASLTAILAMVALAPLLAAAGWFHVLLEYWISVGFPLMALLIWLVFRDAPTAVLGALPVVFGRYVVEVLRPGSVDAWWPFVLALGALFALYLVADWLFIPRPVPPVLYLYVREGPGHPYRRREDAPWWLEGRAYWVWRYMMLTPAELNKFWERDWERFELWIRADGPDAGVLEWVVTDAHYRELWVPPERAGVAQRFRRHCEEARRHARRASPGIWLVEVDAHVIFHTPRLRTVSFLPEGEDVPVRSLRHVASGLFHGETLDDPDPALEALDLLKVRRGRGVLDDLPEAVMSRAARHMVAFPWRYWRYPLGAHRRQERPLYGHDAPAPPPPIADPELQIKEGGPDVP